jgi:AraC-like DNA-binding protein
VSAGAGSIIFLQYRKLKRNLKTMFQMNLSLAYSSHDDAGETAEPVDETVPDLSDSALYKLILRKIEQKELYKDPQLSLHDLAKHVNRRKKVVSRAINNAGKTNFAGLINEFKVNEARRLIMEKGSFIAINDIATMAGFNSRSSFYRHFKELTGFSPTDYIEMMGRMEGPSEETEGEDLG